MDPRLVLVTGANGYIASRLIPRLLDGGHRVRVMARRPERLQGRAWLPRVEIRRGEATDPAALLAAMEGVHTAYYLIHNMSLGRGYQSVERKSAEIFAATAETAGLRHIIYLGGLADPADPHLAPHMRSRIETGEVLRQGRVPVTEFRAGVITGAGSISFEMIRFLTECFPILPGPRWLHNLTQPIAADNVIDYLVAGLEHPASTTALYEMGGPDTMLYREAMMRFAQARGLKRLMFTIPGIPIWWMAWIVDRLTPVPYSIATALIGGLQSDSVIKHNSASAAFPGVELLTYEEAIQLALDELSPDKLERVWEGLDRDVTSFRHEGFIIDYRTQMVTASASEVFEQLRHPTGQHCWPYVDWIWQLRNWIGPMVRLTGFWSHARKNEDPAESQITGSAEQHRPDAPGEVGYCWVEALEENRLLRLRSRIQVPGKAWLEWKVEQVSPGSVRLSQTAFFAPCGFPGFVYWIRLAPAHRKMLRGLLLAIKRRCEAA